MPRYFFDIHDGEALMRDTEGSMHADLIAAELEAADTLTQMGKEIFPITAFRELAIEIRDLDGKSLTVMTLRLAVERR